MKEQFSIFGLWYTTLFTSQLFLSLNKDGYVALLQLKRKLDIFLENWLCTSKNSLPTSSSRYTREQYKTLFRDQNEILLRNNLANNGQQVRPR